MVAEERLRVIRCFLGPRSMVQVIGGWEEDEKKRFADMPLSRDAKGWDVKISLCPPGRLDCILVSIMEAFSELAEKQRKLVLVGELDLKGELRSIAYCDVVYIATPDGDFDVEQQDEEWWLVNGERKFGGLETEFFDAIIHAMERNGKEVTAGDLEKSRQR